MSGPRQRTLVGLALVLTLVGMGAGVVRIVQTRDRIAHEQAQADLERELEAALATIEAQLWILPPAALHPQLAAPLFSSHLQALQDEGRTLTLNTRLNEQGRVCLLATTQDQRELLATDVDALYGGERANGMDDNGNGLIDESGLFFALSGSTLTVGLSLRRPSSRGPLVAFQTRRIPLKGL